MSSLGPTAARILRFGDFELDAESGELRKNGVTIRLQEQPFRILLELLQRPGEVVTRTELRDRLWPADTFVDFETSLNSAVKKLRDALEDSAESPRYIETFKRRGYRFIVPTEVPVRKEPAISSRRNWVWPAVAALAILIGIGLWLGLRPAPTAAVPPIDSIAVLPLDNISRDVDQEYFADGMTDALITNLAQIAGLRVISRTSVIQYKKARKSLPEIARELDVDAIVEGTVARSGSRVRVTAQLIHASTDRHLWARSYERELVDIFSLQGELAQAIADAVEVNVAPQVRASLGNVPRLDRAAVDAFFQGVVAARPQKAEGFAKAIRHYQRAVEIAPDFALAHAAIARLHIQSAFSNVEAPLVFTPKAESAARRSIQADPRLAEAHAILGSILYRFHWDWPGAESEFQRALELSPGDAATQRAYSLFLWAGGRLGEAALHWERARLLDPKLEEIYLDAPRRTREEFDRAVADYRSGMQQRGANTRSWFRLGSALVMDGQFVEGIKALEASQPERLPRSLGYLGYGYGASGNEEKAREILEELRARSKRQYVSSLAIAMVHMGLGEKEAAIERLEDAYREKAFELAHINIIPAFDPLRTEPRYRELLRKVGLK